MQFEVLDKKLQRPSLPVEHKVRNVLQNSISNNGFLLTLHRYKMALIGHVLLRTSSARSSRYFTQ